MSVSIDINPKTLSASDNPNYIQFSSSNFTNEGFRYRLSFLTPLNQVLHTQYLAPNSKLGGACLTDLNYIMKHYVSYYNSFPKTNMIGFDFQTVRFKYLLESEYLATFDIVDHLYQEPWGSEGKTVIDTGSSYNPNIGDVIDIKITTVNGGTFDSQKKIKEALSGVRTVTNNVSPGKFAIDVPFPGNSTSTIGTYTFNNQSKTVDPQFISNEITITKMIGDYDEIHNSTSARYKNDFNNLTAANGFNIYPEKREIFPFQTTYVNVLELKLNTVRKIRFKANGKEAYYLCGGVFNNKLVNVNPNNVDSLIWTSGDYTKPFLDGVKKYTIEFLDYLDVAKKTLTYTVNTECPIFKDELVFVDRMGNIQSVAVTRQKQKEIRIDKRQHLFNSNYTTDNFLSTQNDNVDMYSVNTDWMSHDEYLYTEELIKSPYIWYKEEGKVEKKCILTDNNHEVLSNFNNMFNRTINITILK